MLKSILVVEEEPIIAWQLQEQLTEGGYRVMGPVGDLGAAVARACHADVAGAILETRLGPDDTWCVADVLRARGVPFLFVTARPCTAVPERFRDVPCLNKPYGPAELDAGVAELLGEGVPAH